MNSKGNAVVVKKLVTLESIPEDITSNIIQEIRSWADVEGSLDEREKARKARDSTLRAAALASTKSLQIYLPSLLKNVTISLYSLPGFYQMLNRDTNGLGTMIQSLHIESPVVVDKAVHDEACIYFAALADFPPLSGNTSAQITPEMLEKRFEQGTEKAGRAIYHALNHLKVLILEDPSLMFSFQSRINGKLVQHRFLMESLKKLHISRAVIPSHERYNLSAINSIWLLLFLPQLKETALALQITVKDFRILQELNETFEGLSKVEKLALSIEFVSQNNDKRTWWDLSTEASKFWLGGVNQKGEAVYRLLSVTSHCLKSFELFDSSSSNSDVEVVSQSSPHLSCLSSLHRSFESLEHLRLLSLDCTRNSRTHPNFTSFKKLKTFTCDLLCLLPMLHLPQILLPTSLEVLSLPYYFIDGEVSRSKQKEDEILDHALQSRLLPSLSEVRIPSEHINRLGVSVEYSLSAERLWLISRKNLENNEKFKDGKVKLRKMLPGEKIVGNSSDGGAFMSSLRWLSQ